MKNLREFVWITAWALAACSGKEQESREIPPSKDTTLYEEMDAPLEKAKGVERQLKNDAEKRREEEENQLNQ
ncbi:hypothetical protein [Methylococcus sp. EFPC2]|uniref:hypothetical protein n=1 Tax=Methylococcus sp. EFPC2 TaxID=2812648 RepID=UPI0019670836|nr:hypothetical protein [Methylococcus sp. EFPC2]QSA97017.1 hypothetical protein JWZ97_17725 [Methylococcus sp. EFPC2]